MTENNTIDIVQEDAITDNVDKSDKVDLSLYVLNDKNKYITAEYIEGILKQYNVEYHVNNLQFFQQAMTHASYIKRDLRNDKSLKGILNKEKDYKPSITNKSDAIPLQELSYERLEFLGDSVIHLVLADYLYHRYKTQDQGFLTKLRTKLENGSSLAQLTKIMKINSYSLISGTIEQIGGREKNEHILEDMFESFIAALFLDCGVNFVDFDVLVKSVKKQMGGIINKTLHKYVNSDTESKIIKKINEELENSIHVGITDWVKDQIDKGIYTLNYGICKKFIINVVEKEIDIAKILYIETNYKDTLLQYYHKMKWPKDPEYFMLELVGPEHKKMFKMCVKDNNAKIVGIGVGASKKKGEQEAAKQALLHFGLINEESDDEDEIIDINE